MLGEGKMHAKYAEKTVEGNGFASMLEIYTNCSFYIQIGLKAILSYLKFHIDPFAILRECHNQHYNCGLSLSLNLISLLLYVNNLAI